MPRDATLILRDLAVRVDDLAGADRRRRTSGSSRGRRTAGSPDLPG